MAFQGRRSNDFNTLRAKMIIDGWEDHRNTPLVLRAFAILLGSDYNRPVFLREDYPMAVLRCPTCQMQFDTDSTTAMPFCSDRCRQVDLGRWLNEEIGVPLQPDYDDEFAEE